MSGFKGVIDNPYDPNSQATDDPTLPLDEIIRRAVASAALRLNVWRPAKVTKVLGTQRVNLQVLLLARSVTSKDAYNVPEIQDALVCLPRGKNWSIKLPVAVGDTGIALFCDRSLDIWSVQGGMVDPADVRSHHLSDCVFIPGLYPFSDQIEDETSDLVLTNKSSQIRLLENGKLKIQNTEAGNELIDLMDQLLDTLISNTFTLTMLGAQPFIASTITALQGIRTKLDTLKD